METADAILFSGFVFEVKLQNMYVELQPYFPAIYGLSASNTYVALGPNVAIRFQTDPLPNYTPARKRL